MKRSSVICNLSKTEKSILELLWENKQWMSGANFWDYFNSHGKNYKRSTVNTYLARMTEKGLLVKNGTKYIYVYTKEELDSLQAEEVIDSLFGGSLKRFMTALTGNGKLNKKYVEELIEYMNELKEKE